MGVYAGMGVEVGVIMEDGIQVKVEVENI